MSRWALWIIILLAVAIGAATMLRPRGVPVDVAAVTRRTIQQYIEERGKTRLPEIFQITMPQQGRILPITLIEGQQVTVGQVVAKMDRRDLETDLLEKTNTVKRYDKNIEQLALAILQAEQTVQASQAKYDFSERTFSRTKQLFEKNGESLGKLEEDELRMKEAAVDLRKEQLNKSMYTIAASIVGLLRETEVAKEVKAIRDRDRAEIVSPVDGTVLSKQVSNERVLQPGEVLLELGDLADLEVETDVLTQDAALIEVGDRVEFDALVADPEMPRVTGTVTRIFPQGFTKVSSLGVEQQRVKIVIGFASGLLRMLSDRGHALGVDYRVRVRIYTDEKPSVLVVPRATLFRSASGTWQVFAVRNGLATVVDVTIGLRNDYEVEIMQGLVEGEQVVLAPDSSLAQGILVEPQLIPQQAFVRSEEQR